MKNVHTLHGFGSSQSMGLSSQDKCGIIDKLKKAHMLFCYERMHREPSNDQYQSNSLIMSI